MYVCMHVCEQDNFTPVGAMLRCSERRPRWVFATICVLYMYVCMYVCMYLYIFAAIFFENTCLYVYV